MEYRIGFKGKYYRLYEYNITYEESYGKSYKLEHYTFVKVISMSKEKTIEKYPDVEFDPYANERKYGTFCRRTQIIHDDKFSCGKYAGKYFNMCDDFDYLKWYYNNCATNEQKKIIEPILKNEGYKLIEKEYVEEGAVNDPANIIIKQEMISIEKLKEIENKDNIKNKTIEKLNKHLPFIVNFSRNIHSNGSYFSNDLQITIKFEKYRVSYWNDMVYGMPIDKNGKAKRIKGKQILITNYTLNNDEVIVNEWRFI